MRITLNDGRQMTGQMLAFDKHLNLVLADTEEFRRIRRKESKPAAPGASGQATTTTIEREEKRTLGLTIVRGAHIISLSVESPPPADPSARLGKAPTAGVASGLVAGPGVARPVGRGAPTPISLAGPVAGVGGPGQPFPPGFPGAPGFGRGGRMFFFPHPLLVLYLLLRSPLTLQLLLASLVAPPASHLQASLAHPALRRRRASQARRRRASTRRHGGKRDIAHAEMLCRGSSWWMNPCCPSSWLCF